MEEAPGLMVGYEALLLIHTAIRGMIHPRLDVDDTVAPVEHSQVLNAACYDEGVQSVHSNTYHAGLE